MVKWILLSMVFGLAARAMAGDRVVEIIAHRGASADAPENTMAAFRLAWEQQTDAIELDVHLTHDKKLIVCHDPDAKRTTGTPMVIKDHRFDELRLLDAGRWKGSQWAGEKLPTLVEVLKTIPNGKRCFIEIKVGPDAVSPVAEAIRESGKKPEQFAIISFKAPTLAEAKRKLPNIKAYYLAKFTKDKQTGAWTPGIDTFIEQAKSIHADAIDLSHEGPVDAECVRRIKSASLGFMVWTVDDPAIARRMIDLGAEGVTTNKPALMKVQLTQHKP